MGEVLLRACPAFVLFPGYLALVTARSSTEILNLAFLLLKWSLFILIIYQPDFLAGILLVVVEKNISIAAFIVH